MFIASESMFFASLITTYMVFRYRSVVGPHPQDIINIPLVTRQHVHAADEQLDDGAGGVGGQPRRSPQYRQVFAA